MARWTFIGGRGVYARAAERRSPSWPSPQTGPHFSPPSISAALYWRGQQRAVIARSTSTWVGPVPSLAATGAIVPEASLGTQPSRSLAAISRLGRTATSWLPIRPPGEHGASAARRPYRPATGFDNTLLAAFYVSPSTTFVAFGTTDGGPFGNNNYGQFGFDYGGGRTDYVSFSAVARRRQPRRQGGRSRPDHRAGELGRYGWPSVLDFNGDGIVDMNDLTIVLANFGRTLRRGHYGRAGAGERCSARLSSHSACSPLLGDGGRRVGRGPAGTNGALPMFSALIKVGLLQILGIFWNWAHCGAPVLLPDRPGLSYL